MITFCQWDYTDLEDGWLELKCSRCGTVHITKYRKVDRVCTGEYKGIVDGRRKGRKLLIFPVQQQTGPGTELKKILDESGLKGWCKTCENWAGQMNKWGPEGCREHRAEIIERLKEQADKRSWFVKGWAGTWFIRQPWFRLNDQYGSIVDEAIRRATVSASVASPADTPVGSRD
jgi:hypothetical protein